eukprot:1587812-Prymnesium_polylepis.2
MFDRVRASATIRRKSLASVPSALAHQSKQHHRPRIEDTRRFAVVGAVQPRAHVRCAPREMRVPLRRGYVPHEQRGDARRAQRHHGRRVVERPCCLPLRSAALARPTVRVGGVGAAGRIGEGLRASFPPHKTNAGIARSAQYRADATTTLVASGREEPGNKVVREAERLALAVAHPGAHDDHVARVHNRRLLLHEPLRRLHSSRMSRQHTDPPRRSAWRCRRVGAPILVRRVSYAHAPRRASVWVWPAAIDGAHPRRAVLRAKADERRRR